VLRYLRDRDPSPWPAGLPTDPEHARWEFAWHGVPIFVVCNTPAHVRRRSRHSPQFMITFQPRWVFEELGPGSARGVAARRVIRRRVRAFDGMEPAADLGDYGAAGNREWRQYYLSDGDGDGLPARCPLREDEEVPWTWRASTPTPSCGRSRRTRRSGRPSGPS
jgi:FPC/CPF motif-containing protein YcgG